MKLRATAAMAILKKQTIALSRLGTSSFSILKYMSDSIILQLVSLCKINTGNNKENTDKNIAMYRRTDIDNKTLDTIHITL